jgi:putative Ca2+/H+ antiporter (TMEM165/GDT1 family)
VSAGPENHVESFLVSTGLVALAEMGDKTQLLSFMLAARYRRPWPIIAGILIATLANHALAGALGDFIPQVANKQVLRWIVAGSFLAMAAWMLVPDAPRTETRARPDASVLVTTVVAFFLAEMGDKTQIATVLLAARFATFAPVVAGTTLGMMLANVPAVLLGERLAERAPLRLMQRVAAVICAALGVLALVAG